MSETKVNKPMLPISLKAANGKATDRRVWSIPLHGVLVPFLTATNATGESHIPADALGCPLRLAREKDGRPRHQWLRVPTYESFVKYFGHCRRLGLVEFVRDEPLVWGHPQMLSIRPPDQVVTSTRRVYRLSDMGAHPASDLFWEDPLLRSLFRAALGGAVTPPPPG